MFTQEFAFETSSVSDLEETLLAVCPVIFRDRMEYIQVKPLDPRAETESYPSYAAAWWSAHFNPQWIKDYWANEVPRPLFPDQDDPFTHIGTKPRAPFYVHWQACSINYVWDAEPSAETSCESIVKAAVQYLTDCDFREFAETDISGLIMRREHEGPFRGNDGCVTIGYRAHLSQRWGDRIRLSRCHIYHPK